MSAVSPLETFYDVSPGIAVPLPDRLQQLYGPLRVTASGDRPIVIGNFVTTLDGVVALTSGRGSGGSEISGSNPHDRALMGLLRSVADVIVVGAGTVRATPRHLWTPAAAFAPLAAEYFALRGAMSKEALPHRAIVTGGGEVDLGLPVFTSEPRPTLVVTTARGERQLLKQAVPTSVRVTADGTSDRVTARTIVDGAQALFSAHVVLVEGGPQVIGQFLEEKLLDELFLTLAPQVAGRDGKMERPGLIAGHLFAPLDPRWALLVSVKRGGSHLFLRYRFDR